MIYIYNLGGVLILYMIFVYHLKGACSLDDNEFFRYICLAFHFFMGWFFFKSGMFFKNRDISDLIRRSFKHLMIPYFIFSLLSLMIGFVISMIIDNNLVTFFRLIPIQIVYDEAVSWNQALWFLPSLYFVKVIYILLHKKKINDVAIMVVFVLLSIIMNYYSYKMSSPFHIPYYIGNVFLGMVFYAMGHCLRNANISRFLLYVITFIYVFHFFFPSSIDFYKNMLYGNYIISVVYFSSGILLFNLMFKKFANKPIPLLTHIGKFSMIYYVCHWPLIKCIKIYEVNSIVSGETLYFFGFLLLCLFLWVCDLIFRSPKQKWMVGM